MCVVEGGVADYRDREGRIDPAPSWIADRRARSLPRILGPGPSRSGFETKVTQSAAIYRYL